MGLLEKLKKNSLIGRSGSQFPVWKKWQSIAEETGDKYLICNAAESEPDVFKDKYLLRENSEYIIEAIQETMKALGITKGFIYIRKDYYKLFQKKLKALLAETDIDLKIKEEKYIAGEETSAINSIEGNRPEPKRKPPYPTKKGLWGKPTLIHNLETFYAISEIIRENYKHEKFYCISGAVENKGVFKLKEDLSIEEVLMETNNFPEFDFLVQIGGGAGGIFIKEGQLDRQCERLGSIRVYRKDKFNPKQKMKSIAWFLMHGNCDKCTPCREGVYRVYEMLESGYYDESLLQDIILALKESSYCPLGKVAGEVFSSLVDIYEN
ncbi:MAG: NADH-ubiquinone oxidoreductase-F iron-sulfur binding region domain-containing protein [Patescibacteria group bacterium]